MAADRHDDIESVPERSARYSGVKEVDRTLDVILSVQRILSGTQCSCTRLALIQQSIVGWRELLPGINNAANRIGET
ncbi:hypothetical protein D3C84_1015450 [compost metagenome]